MAASGFTEGSPRWINASARVALCLCFSTAIAASDADDRRTAGQLLEAARLYENRRTLPGYLRAFECYLHSGDLERATGVLSKARAIASENPVVLAWARCLAGSPCLALNDDQKKSSTPEECLLAGLWCRLLGTSESESAFLRRAYSASGHGPLYGSELARSLAAGHKLREAAEVLAEIDDCAEKTLVLAELAIARGDLFAARNLLSRGYGRSATGDPRWRSLRSLAAEHDRGSVSAIVHGYEQRLKSAFWRFEPDTSEAHAAKLGCTVEQSVKKQTEEFAKRWEQRTLTLARKHAGTPIAGRLRSALAGRLCILTYLGEIPELEGVARRALAHLLFAFASNPNACTGTLRISNMSYLLDNLGNSVSFDMLAVALQRHTVRHRTRAAVMFERARSLRRRGHPERALPLLTGLSKSMKGLLDDERLLSRELYWAELEVKKAPFFTDRIVDVDGKTHSLAGGGARVRVIELFEPD